MKILRLRQCKMIRLALLLFFVPAPVVSADPVLAADGGVGRASVPTITRLVKIFLELESTLTIDSRDGNRDAVEKMLADDFELRVGHMPGIPTSRADWLRQSMGKPGARSRIEQMAAHDYGNIVIVSSLQTKDAGDKSARAGDIFVVDVWKRAEASWKLAVRYSSPAGSPDFEIPGASRTPSTVDKRY
jgi:hypothetical protein